MATYTYVDSGDEEYTEFVLVVSRNCVTLKFLDTSRFDGVGHNYMATEIVETLQCARCRNGSRKLLAWITNCRDDMELAEWCCLQYSYKKEDSMTLVCHSPRSCAIQVLLDEYKCKLCRK
jgi:hypothetical protein